LAVSLFSLLFLDGRLISIFFSRRLIGWGKITNGKTTEPETNKETFGFVLADD
jgi:hypothetical protein